MQGNSNEKGCLRNSVKSLQDFFEYLLYKLTDFNNPIFII